MDDTGLRRRELHEAFDVAITRPSAASFPEPGEVAYEDLLDQVWALAGDWPRRGR